MTDPAVELVCICCSSPTLGRQWRNQPSGFGLCNKCVDFCKWAETEDSFQRMYGYQGVHYSVELDLAR